MKFGPSGHSGGWRMTTSRLKCQLYMPHLLIQLCMTPFVFSREIEKDILSKTTQCCQKSKFKLHLNLY